MPNNIQAMLTELRGDADKLPRFTSLGGYTMLYLAGDGEPLCASCADSPESRAATAAPASDFPDRDWRIVAVGPYWEGPTLNCAHCSADIESSYSDPDAETGDAS